MYSNFTLFWIIEQVSVINFLINATYFEVTRTALSEQVTLDTAVPSSGESQTVPILQDLLH